MKKYRIKEIFYGIQGEGVRVGVASIFVRFAGCNLRCRKSWAGFDCDTDFRYGKMMSARDIVDDCNDKWKGDGGERWIIFTGGEPAMQLDKHLMKEFGARYDVCRPVSSAWKYAIETNGTLPLPHGLDWITYSPKPGKPPIDRWVNEVKVVLPDGVLPPEYPFIFANYWLLSPVFDGNRVNRKSLNHCIRMVAKYPKWRLSVQTHKYIGVK